MTQQEYEQKREQEWQTFCNRHGMLDRGHVMIISAFFEAFDRAYALGKQEKDGIDLKKLNEMLDDTLKKETKESLNQWLSEKDADTMTISKDKYYKLCKYSRYVDNWVPYFDVCPICGEYNQRGCVCANCNNDKNWNNGETDNVV